MAKGGKSMPTSDSCQNLCTALADLTPTPISALGVCDFPVTGFTISDVVVTGCTIDLLVIEPLSETVVAVSVGVIISFTYTGTRPDGSTFADTGECNATVQFKASPVQEDYSLAEDIPCAANLSCTAVDAGYDPTLGVEEFIVSISGTLSCYGCQTAVVTVQECTEVQA